MRLETAQMQRQRLAASKLVKARINSLEAEEAEQAALCAAHDGQLEAAGMALEDAPPDARRKVEGARQSLAGIRQTLQMYRNMEAKQG